MFFNSTYHIVYIIKDTEIIILYLVFFGIFAIKNIVDIVNEIITTLASQLRFKI